MEISQKELEIFKSKNIKQQFKIVFDIIEFINKQDKIFYEENKGIESHVRKEKYLEDKTNVVSFLLENISYDFNEEKNRELFKTEDEKFSFVEKVLQKNEERAFIDDLRYVVNDSVYQLKKVIEKGFSVNGFYQDYLIINEFERNYEVEKRINKNQEDVLSKTLESYFDQIERQEEDLTKEKIEKTIDLFKIFTKQKLKENQRPHEEIEEFLNNKIKSPEDFYVQKIVEKIVDKVKDYKPCNIDIDLDSVDKSIAFKIFEEINKKNKQPQERSRYFDFDRVYKEFFNLFSHFPEISKQQDKYIDEKLDFVEFVNKLVNEGGFYSRENIEKSLLVINKKLKEWGERTLKDLEKQLKLTDFDSLLNEEIALHKACQNIKTTKHIYLYLLNNINNINNQLNMLNRGKVLEIKNQIYETNLQNFLEFYEKLNNILSVENYKLHQNAWVQNNLNLTYEREAVTNFKLPVDVQLNDKVLDLSEKILLKVEKMIDFENENLKTFFNNPTLNKNGIVVFEKDKLKQDKEFKTILTNQIKTYLNLFENLTKIEDTKIKNILEVREKLIKKYEDLDGTIDQCYRYISEIAEEKNKKLDKELDLAIKKQQKEYGKHKKSTLKEALKLIK